MCKHNGSVFFLVFSFLENCLAIKSIITLGKRNQSGVYSWQLLATSDPPTHTHVCHALV